MSHTVKYSQVTSYTRIRFVSQHVRWRLQAPPHPGYGNCGYRSTLEVQSSTVLCAHYLPFSLFYKRKVTSRCAICTLGAESKRMLTGSRTLILHNSKLRAMEQEQASVSVPGIFVFLFQRAVGVRSKCV